MARDTSRDGFRNKLEAFVLNGFEPFWAFVNRTPWLSRFANGLIVNNATLKAPCRPLALSTQADYTNWSTLTDRSWFSRYLPPAPQDDLPTVAEVASLFKLREGRPPVLSDRSTLLFPSFAQWFTDGFLMTDQDRRRTRTNHQIDLSQLYGLDHTVTSALRRHSEHPGEKGKLKSVISANGEWAPALYDATGQRDPAFAVVPEPVHLPGDWPSEKRAALFAFGGERANSTAFTASVNTLFLREHNRLCTMLEAAQPGVGRRARVPDRAQHQHRAADQTGRRRIHQSYFALLDEIARRSHARLHGKMEPRKLDPGRIQPALSLAQPDPGDRDLERRTGRSCRAALR